MDQDRNLFFSHPGGIVELFCEKHQKMIKADKPRCAHGREYCRFRSSCIIHFMEQEEKREQRKKEQEKKDVETEL